MGQILNFCRECDDQRGCDSCTDLHNWIVEHIVPPIIQPVNGNTSDGYHTFNELYHHRAVLFSVIVKMFPTAAWKSKQHHDGSMFDGMFIVGIDTPDGQATYHYDLEPYWEMFECVELERAPVFDGHTPDDAIARIGKLDTPKAAIRENIIRTQAHLNRREERARSQFQHEMEIIGATRERLEEEWRIANEQD